MESHEILFSPAFYAGLANVVPCALWPINKLPRAVGTLAALGASAVLLDIAWQTRAVADPYAVPEIISSLTWGVVAALVVLSAVNDRRERKA